MTDIALGAGPTSDVPIPDARLRAAHAALAAGDVAVLSLDLFDTLVWRGVPEPVGAFELVAAQLHARGLLDPDVDPQTFAALRRAAEERAREQARAAGRGVEVTLEEICAALPSAALTHGAAAAALVTAELDVERSLLRCDLDVLDLVRAGRAAGAQVIAVSDTYFTEPQLRLLLARGPLAAELPDRFFPSSRYGTGKASGLWSIVLESLGVEPEAILHVGDNHAADVQAPSKLGIRTCYFERVPRELERIVEREQALAPAVLHADHGDHGLTMLRGKAASRTEGARQPEGLRPFWQFGATVLGPPLAGFGEWVHERAAAAGVSKIFCLMREGELLAQVIDGARPEGGPPAEKLFLSRQVVARAAIVEGTRDELQELFVRRRMPTLKEFVATLGLSLDDVPDLAHEPDRQIDDAGLGDLVIERVLFDSALSARVVANSHALRRRIIRYLEQLRPPGENRLLVVDLGWGGTIQAAMQRLLDEAGDGVTTVGCYLVTRDQAVERALGGLEMHGFLGSYGEPEAAVQALIRSPEILEQACMPDHGSQVDLTEELRPVLADHGEPSFQSLQRSAVQQGVLAFQLEHRRYREADSCALPALHQGGRDQLRAILVRSVAAPTADEAALFGAWLHDENFGSDRVEAILEAPSARSLAYVDPKQLAELPMAELYWPFGLAALQDEQLAAAAAAVASGAVTWEAFGSELETGPFEVFPDLGWGFGEGLKYELPQRRNRRGLSLAKATVRGDFVRRIRLDPAKHASVLRIDWIRLRCRLHGGGETVIEIADDASFASLKLRGARLIGPRVVLAHSDDPSIEIDIEQRAGGRVFEVDIEVAFAALPLRAGQAVESRRRLRAWARRMGKESRAGAPIRVVVRALRNRGRL
jgi:predicted HAD superfamily hydrolase